MQTILSLCDFSGNWSLPYIGKGYLVLRIDPKHKGKLVQMPDGGFSLGLYVEEAASSNLSILEEEVHGILAAPPCTDFASSGARTWAEKDLDGRTQKSIRLVEACLAIINRAKPTFWALENPVGRIAKLIPSLGKPTLIFHPHLYADWTSNSTMEAYTKKTCLWGKFNPNLPRASIEPITIGGKVGGYMHLKFGGKSEKTKTIRSTTPLGFAYAFAEANP
jgi:hypothetical protein